MGTLDLASNPDLLRTGWSLLFDASLKAGLLLVFGGGLALSLRRAPAEVRHRVWTLALIGALCMPVATLVLPPIPVPVPGLVATPEVAPQLLRAAPVGPIPEARAAEPRASVDRRGATAQPFPALGSPPLATGWLSWGLGIWLAGLLLVGLRLLVGSAVTRGVARGAKALKDPSWLVLAAEIAEELDVPRAFRLLTSDRISVPMTWGWTRPIIALPSEALDWPEDRRRAVLAHELAHVKRYDCASQLVAHGACAAYWFNPLSWVAAWRLRVERERACDDQVLKAGTRASDYATFLLDVARSRHGMLLASPASVAMARRSQLEGRLLAILDPGVRRVAGRLASVVVGLAVAAPMLLLASLQPVAGAVASEIDSTPIATELSATADTEGEGLEALLDSESTPQYLARAVEGASERARSSQTARASERASERAQSSERTRERIRDALRGA